MSAAGRSIQRSALTAGAVLALLTLYDWPARETCAGCGRKRVVDREECEHCGAAFPPPEKTGAEIFDAESEAYVAGER